MTLSLKCKDGWTYASQQINWLKDKNHAIISTNAKNSFDKIQLVFMVKVLDSIVVKGTHLNTLKGIYKKITVNIILHGENLQETTLKTGTRQGYPLSQLL